MAIRILNPSTDAYTKTVVNDKLGSYYTISDLASKGYRKITWSTITIAKTAWDSNKKTATVSVSGVTADNAVDVAPTEATYDAYVSAGIRASAQGSGTLTFKCKTVPTAAISVNIKTYSN
jgi:hypothetical protein